MGSYQLGGAASGIRYSGVGVRKSVAHTASKPSRSAASTVLTISAGPANPIGTNTPSRQVGISMSNFIVCCDVLEMTWNVGSDADSKLIRHTAAHAGPLAIRSLKGCAAYANIKTGHIQATTCCPWGASMRGRRSSRVPITEGVGHDNFAITQALWSPNPRRRCRPRGPGPSRVGPVQEDRVRD